MYILSQYIKSQVTPSYKTAAAIKKDNQLLTVKQEFLNYLTGM